jgi:hypothetical protein
MELLSFAERSAIAIEKYFQVNLENFTILALKISVQK